MRKRSPSYPSKPILSIENFVVSVFEKVGDTALNYNDLAKHGGVPVREADEYASTASQYGWLTQERGKGYSPNSAICKALRNPKNEEEKNKLYMGAFLAPQLYKLICTDFNRKKITLDGLKIYLIRDREFSDIGADVASQIFIDNAKFLGIIDTESTLNIDADIKIDLSTIKERQPKSVKATSSAAKKDSGKARVLEVQPPPSGNNSNTMKKISVFVRGQELHFQVLEDMNQGDWDALIKQLQNIKSFSK